MSIIRSIVALLAVVTLAACGEEGGTTTVVQQAPPVTETVPADPVEEEQPLVEEDLAEEPVEAVKLPNLKGERLDVAQSRLDDRGITYEEVGGGAFGVIDPSNWEVCRTMPSAGTKVRDRTVKLIVERPDAC